MKPCQPGVPPAVLEGTEDKFRLIRVSGPAELVPTHRVIARSYVRALPDAAGPARVLTDAEHAELVKSLDAPAPAVKPAEPIPPAEPPDEPKPAS